jgi:hypothetical protein
LKAQAKEDSAALSPDNPFFDAPSQLRIKVKAEVVHSRLKSIIWSIPGVKFEQRENSTFISGLGDDENEKLVLLEYTMTTLRKIAASKSSKEQEAMISELSKKLNIDKLNPEEQILNIIDNPQGISLEKIRDAAFVLIDELQKQNKNKKR